jgi:hypothetical protein
MPASTAFWTSSNEARPLTSSTEPASGSRPDRSAQPTILSTALCRPTSSRMASSRPSAVNSPAACSPPVDSNTRCAARSSSGSPASTSGVTRAWSAARSKREATASSSMLALPHTPHALVVMKLRRSPAATARPGRSVTSAMLPIPSWPAWPQRWPSQIMIPAMSSGSATTPSLTRNPAARSMSSPGVRMVSASASPPTRMPSGSSAASRSARVAARADWPASPGSEIRSTRRRAVLPLIRALLTPLARHPGLGGPRRRPPGLPCRAYVRFDRSRGGLQA